jgi:hypothetical protein
MNPAGMRDIPVHANAHEAPETLRAWLEVERAA